MAYKRVVSLEVVNNNTQLVTLNNLDFEFNVDRSITLGNNTAEIVVYNMKTETRNNVLKTGNNIILKAGYEDEGGVLSIFFGTIHTVNTVKQETEWITTIQAIDIGSNKQPLIYEPVSYSYIANSPLVQVISDVVSILGIPVFGLENVTQVLSNGFVHVGSINSLLKEIEKKLKNDDLGLYFDNSQMIIYRIGVQESKFGLVFVSNYTGLIGSVENITDENSQDGKKRIRFRSLLNGKIQPNTLIQLTSNTDNGLFFVEKVSHFGDTFGGSFFSDVECAE